MCGRYTLASNADEVVEAFDVPPLTFDHHPRYNITPGQDAPVCARDGRGRRVGLLRWGLVPGWSDTPSQSFINARGESVATTASFRDAFRNRRCLVPADGFYEWRREGRGRVPFYFRPSHGGLVSLAGIWERWERPGHEPHFGFAIVTVDANSEVAAIHHRMPAVIAAADRLAWLDPHTPPERLRGMVGTAPPGTFTAWRVSTRVNSLGADDAGLVEPVEG